MPTKKIACLGAGSWYFGQTLGDIVVPEGLRGSQIALYDIDADKNRLMARHGQRLADMAGTGMRVRACETLAEAVDGCDFALAAIGGAGKSRQNVYGTGVHARDIAIPAKYGIHQIVGDTGGPAGMMMALRSVPAYVGFCREMEKRAPRGILFNHSNPMAVLCRAMEKYTGVQVVGICHGVQIGIKVVAHALQVPPEELECVWVGTNHYHWFTRIWHKGRDVYPEVRRRFAEMDTPHDNVMTQRLSEVYGFRIVYPDDAHALEFYPFLAQAPDAEHIPYGHHLGGHHGMPGSEDDAEYLARYEADLGKIGLPAREASVFDGEGLGVLLEAIATGRRHVHVVNVANRGSIPNLPDYANVEVEAVTDSAGLRPIYAGPAPVALAGLLQKRIAWQELVADAAVTGDRGLALQALLVDEMAIVPEKAEAMLGELLESSREYLPQFA